MLMPASRPRRPSDQPLRLGFVALCDCAPIVMAQELGLFAKHGLNVQLRREAGWATIRDKIIYGELDAAHATAPMVFAATLGLGSIRVPCVTGLLLNLHGLGITLSNKLWHEGVRDGRTLREYSQRSRDPLIFGTVFPFSSHHFLLREWLLTHGLQIGKDAHIVVVPPAQMFQNMKAGHLDGYCVGEPWNSMAIASNVGWCAALGSELSPRYPEKALMVRRDFAECRSVEHLALLAALLEACRYCDQLGNRAGIAKILAQPNYVNAPVEALRMSLLGRFDFGHGRIEDTPDFHLFSRGGANEPLPEKADWILDHLKQCQLLGGNDAEAARLAPHIFRRDLYHQALVMASSSRALAIF